MPKIIASSVLAAFIFLLLWFNIEARPSGGGRPGRESRAVIGPGGVDRPGIGPGGVENPGIGPGGVDRPGIGPGGMNPRPIQRTPSLSGPNNR